MKIANATEEQVKIQLVKIIVWAGYKNQDPKHDFTWWYRDGKPDTDEFSIVYLGTVVSLMNNDIAMEHFLLEVLDKISITNNGNISIHQGVWTVSITETIHSKSFLEALFRSISKFINIK